MMNSNYYLFSEELVAKEQISCKFATTLAHWPASSAPSCSGLADELQSRDNETIEGPGTDLTLTEPETRRSSQLSVLM